MGIYLNKWSGELQLEIKEGCVHGTWMPPLLTNSWIFFYLIKAYHKFYNFVLHKGHNSEISKVKLIEIELDLPLVILNNISKFGFDLVEWQSSYWTETINFTIWYFIKGHNFGTSKVKSVKTELDLLLVVPNNISKFQNIWAKLI